MVWKRRWWVAEYYTLRSCRNLKTLYCMHAFFNFDKHFFYEFSLSGRHSTDWAQLSYLPWGYLPYLPRV